MDITTSDIVATFHNIIDTKSAGDVMEIFEGGEKRLYLIVAVCQVGDKVTYWLRAV